MTGEVGLLHPNAFALQGIGLAETCIVLAGPAFTGSRHRIGTVRTGTGPQQIRRILHGAAHGPGRILRGGDGDDAAPAPEAHGGLDAHHAAERGGSDDGAVGLGADGDGAEIGGHRSTRSRTGAAGVTVQHVGVLGLPAPAAPAAAGPCGPEIGPLAEVGLAQQHRACLAQPGHDERIAGSAVAFQRQRARRGHHLIPRINIVFDQHRYAVQRPADLAGLPLRIHLRRDGQRIGIHFDHGVERGTVLVDGLDAVQIFLRELSGTEFAAGHLLLQLIHRGLIEIEFHGIGKIRRPGEGRSRNG